MKRTALFVYLGILLLVTVPTVTARSINVNEPIHRIGWNLISGTGYYQDETIDVKCEQSASHFINLGTVKADNDGSWLLYFSIEDINYWPVEAGESRILITVFSSRGIPKKIFMDVSDDIDRSVYPPRDYFQTPIHSQTRIINDILWMIYVNPDVSSTMYREVSMDRIVQNRLLFKNLHHKMRDKYNEL